LIQTGPWHFLTDYLGRVFGDTGAVVEPAAALLTLVVVLLGLAVAYRRFGAGQVDERAPVVLSRAFFWDDLYQRALVGPLWASGWWLYRYVEAPLVMGVADAAAGVATAAGREVRRLQSGYLRSYAMLFAAAALVAVVAIGWGLR
jgi:NADH-quinone oxidoreductase subunit L